VNVADFHVYTGTSTANFGRFSFCSSLDILWNYDTANACFQGSSDWKLWHDACAFFMNCDLFFPAFVGSLSSIKAFSTKSIW